MGVAEEVIAAQVVRISSVTRICAALAPLPVRMPSCFLMKIATNSTSVKLDSWHVGSIALKDSISTRRKWSVIGRGLHAVTIGYLALNDASQESHVQVINKCQI